MPPLGGGDDCGRADGCETDGGDGDVGAASLEGTGAVGGANGAGRGSTTSMAARAGDDTMWSSDADSLGGAGVTKRGEANAPSYGNVGVEGGEADVDVGVVGGEAAGGVANGGVARADRGEKISSLSSSRSRSSSTSFCRRLVLFAGGG
jgi:hypothetical protein